MTLQGILFPGSSEKKKVSLLLSIKLAYGEKSVKIDIPKKKKNLIEGVF